MKEKLSFCLFYVGLLSAAVAMLVTSGAFRATLSEQISQELKMEGGILASSVSFLKSTEDLKLFSSPTLRITLVSPNGNVLFESEAEKDSMDLHLFRPEVREAVKAGEGFSLRESRTVGTDVYYYAKKLPDGNILRLAVEKKGAYSVLSPVYPKLIALLLAILALSFVMAHVLSNRFVRPIRMLAENLDSLKFPEGDVLYKEFAPFAREIQSQRECAKREMSRLQFEQKRFRTLIEDMSEGMILLDADGEILMVNGAAREMFGAEGNFSGKRLGDFSGDAALNAAANAAEKGKKGDAEIRVSGKDVRLVASPVKVSGEVAGVILILIDITEKKNLSDLREMFTANVSHELKTPLTSIVGYAEMVETGMAKPEDVPRFAGKIRKEAERLISLSKDIMKLSELDERKGTLPHSEKVDIAEVLSEVKSSTESLAAGRSVSVTVPAKAFSVRGDRGLLFELFYNLVHNAIRYNRDGGCVKVLCDGRSIIVEDSGMGISEEHFPHLFERFYRASKSRSKESGGTGLGLSIVKHIAELHGGTVTFTSKLSEGSRFKVTFPNVRPRERPAFTK